MANVIDEGQFVVYIILLHHYLHFCWWILMVFALQSHIVTSTFISLTPAAAPIAPSIASPNSLGRSLCHLDSIFRL